MYLFAFKIIFKILNKSTQYISFIAIALFLTFFLMIQEGLVTYEDKFINSLKGLYPEFVTNSTSTLENLKRLHVDVVKEIFVYSEEIMFSYGDDEEISKFMNVRTFDIQHKEELFSTISILGECNESETTVWLSNRLYKNMLQDSLFDKEHIYFVDNDDEYKEHNICIFELSNDEKWLVTSTSNAKNMAYMPLPTNSIYTNDPKIKELLYNTKKVNNWKKYIDYEDLGAFLLAQHVSQSFLFAFFIFLIIFMIITFSSLAKEFEASIFLQKMFGMSLLNTIFLFSMFFVLYVLVLIGLVVVEYMLFSFIVFNVLDVKIFLNVENLMIIAVGLICIGVLVSALVTKKYHRLPV